VTDTSTPGSVSAIVNGEFIGPVQTILTAQPTFVAKNTDWNSFDVPRMWDMVRDEASQAAWAQARGWENLAQLLAAQHDSLKRLRDDLMAGWDPTISLGAQAYFKAVDRLLGSMREDAFAHSSTARGVDGILAALQVAREKIGPMKTEWDSVTTDLVPEWWDSAAAELNEKARRVMIESDAAIADHRTNVVIPAALGRSIWDPHAPPVITGTGTGAGTATGRGTSRSAGDDVNPPPPIPGYDPLLAGGAMGAYGPTLEGLVQPVAAVPGSPISVLPVPPGNPYAPGGGAYVLPGPGVGRGGWITPMPIGTRNGSGGGVGGQGRGVGAGLTSNSKSMASGGILPMAAPMGASGRRGDATSEGRRVRDVVWEVSQGVDPVIGATDLAEWRTKQAQRDEEEARFVDWFASVATPWSDDLKVTITRRPEEPS
jgi:hypothetical protein